MRKKLFLFQVHSKKSGQVSNILLYSNCRACLCNGCVMYLYLNSMIINHCIRKTLAETLGNSTFDCMNN